MSDVTNAAERLGQFCDGFMPPDQQDPYRMSGQYYEDVCRLVQNYFAEHDETPVDEAWLLSVGATKRGTSLELGNLRITKRHSAWSVEVSYWQHSHFPDYAPLCDVKTIGDVKRLCQVLGIELTPPA